ncbi:Polysaccharide pyruvyl transferase [compost metagenome]
MKIALVTIHDSTNYGAVLQAYATQTILSRFGEVTIINYDNKYLSQQMKLLRFECTSHGLLKFAHDLLRLPFRMKQLGKFNTFFNKRMFLSKRMSAALLFDGAAEEFDVYVCGSDQIWNPQVVNEHGVIDDVYFLAFAPEGSKKISYASSIGHHQFIGGDKRIVANLLHDFSAISLREADGVTMISEILEEKNIKHVLDPTLLLSDSEWREIVTVKNSDKVEKYILVYTVPRSDLMRRAITYYKETLGIKVIGIDPMLKPIGPFDTHVRDAGPEDFVELFSNAEFVVTDSFHGVCFSVNFGKPFVLVSPGKRSNRMVSLFNLLGLNDRMVNSELEFERIKLSNADLVDAQAKLSFYRSQSLTFIEGGLGV